MFRIGIGFSINTKELKERSPTDGCTPIFIAATFTTNKAEAIYVHINRWMIKQNETDKYNGLLLILKKRKF